ncbi:MAG: glycogen synthase GlgA [Pirellulaceae bacterium]|nr:glycogen synthase GlgA [Pirellulaceae bacterium]
MIPLAKTGGLGDVCGSLPVALEQCGCRCSAFLPAYRSVMRSGLRIEPTPHTFTIPIGGRHVACRILHTQLPNSSVDVYLIDQPQYYDRDGLYHDRHGEYRDNCERFSFFCRAVIQAIEQLNLDVDIIHCHDWQAGLVPAYVETKLGGFRWMDRVRSVMTIHNLAYQGRFWHVDMPLTGLDWQYFNFHQMEFHGELNLMKTGIAFANTVTTVSPTYAREITLPEFGCGLEASLKARGDQLVGIVNGVDYAQWNPKTDQHLPANYSVDDWQVGKAQCKHALQQELGLEVDPALPLIGIVSRLADQKGWDLIIPLLEHWVTSRDVQWAILGTGAPHYEAQLRQLAQQAPHRLALRLEFSEQAAHRIEAACDMFLMPSRYEPCGLNQLYSLKYGSVPVVHTTGGLADTVRDASPANLLNKSATGFRFDDYSLVGLERAVNKAVDSYLHNQPQWAQIVETGMRDDWSWEQSAKRYMEIFDRTLHREYSSG